MRQFNTVAEVSVMLVDIDDGNSNYCLTEGTTVTLITI